MHVASTPQHVRRRLELPLDNIRLYLDLTPPQYIALCKPPSKKKVSRVIDAYCATHAGDYCVLGCAAVGRITLADEGVSRCYLSFSPSSYSLHLSEFGWTQTHSYFAIMGGFLYKQDRGNLDTKAVFASPYHDPLKTLIRRRRIILSEEEIQDKSKGDIFSKGLVLLQTSWFIIQFFARVGQQLPVTEIELVTLAYAFLNFATYFFWWNKPQNSGCPVRVYADELGDPPETEPETAVPTPTDNPDDPPSSDLELSRLNIENQVEDLLDTLPPPVSVTVEDELRFFSSEIGLSTSFVFIVTTLLVGNDIYKDIVMICTYAGRLPARETLRAFAFASGLATVFGAMHIAAWSFDFPSSFEQVAWRTYAVLLVILPVYSFLFFIQFHRNGLTRSAIAHFKPGSLAAIAYFNVPVFLGGVYIIARLALLVLMFVLLRKVPPGVYKSVSWTNYIPHF